MDRKRTSVGLDVHARSVVACGLDGLTGELFERRLTPDHAEVTGWLRSLPGPVAVTYEAGPIGFGLARFLIGEGVGCEVAAPSKLREGTTLAARPRNLLAPNSPSGGSQPANIRLTTRRYRDARPTTGCLRTTERCPRRRP